MNSPTKPDDSYPGSSVAAAGNVVICALIAIAIPIGVLAFGMRGTDLLIAGGAFVMAVVLEVQFVRKMLRDRRQGD
jgi:hypothetical protein